MRVNMEYKKLNDEEKLSFLGLRENQKFELVELVGRYIIENKKAYEVLSNGKKVEVKGLYDNIINGSWHIKWVVKGRAYE